MALWLLFAVALAADVPVALADLPAPVRSAVEARWPGCTLIEAEREGDAYDVEFSTKDGRFEAEVGPKGDIREVEREDGPDDEDEDEDDDDDDDDDDVK